VSDNSNPTTYSGAWHELANALNESKVDSFFDECFKEMKNLYDHIGRPKGFREEEFWEWAKEELFRSRKRSLHKQEDVIRALEESMKRKL
jgi:siderophore synthetase component